MKNNWKKVRLGDILEKIIGGGTPSRVIDDFWNGDIFWATVKDMKDGVYKLSETQEKISEKGVKSSATNIIPKNTVIISTRMGLGRCFINQADMAINQDLKALIPNKNVDANFLLWLLVSKTKEIEVMGTGTTVKGIRLEELKNIEIIIPENIEDQKKIASILSAYDDLIENNSRRIKILEEMAQAIYKEWFVDFHFPNFEKVKMIEGELGLMPEGWGVGHLSDLTKITMGQSPKSEFYNEDMLGLPFHQGVTNFGKRFPTDKTFCTLGSKFADSGDILFSVRAPVGRINVANKRIIIGRGVSAIRNKNNNQTFQYYQLKHIFEKEDSIGSGAIFNAVSKQDMENIKIAILDAEIIKKFEHAIFPADSMLINLYGQADNLRQTRDLLLPKLMNPNLDF